MEANTLAILFKELLEIHSAVKKDKKVHNFASDLSESAAITTRQE